MPGAGVAKDLLHEPGGVNVGEDSDCDDPIETLDRETLKESEPEPSGIPRPYLKKVFFTESLTIVSRSC